MEWVPHWRCTRELHVKRLFGTVIARFRGWCAESCLPPDNQAWGVMEAHNGNPKKARELFQQGSRRCEPHAPLLNAWAHFEASMIANLTKPDPNPAHEPFPAMLLGADPIH